MSGRSWTQDECETMRLSYAEHPTYVLAYLLNRTERAVYMQAEKMGLKKSAAYLASELCGRWDGKRGGATRFKPGQVPANKGVKRGKGWAPGRMAEAQFKPGHKPHTWNPVGHERVTRDGYLEIKIRDTGCTRDDYVAVHRLVWERERGPIPAGHIVVFRPGHRTTDFKAITADRLECITRVELMRRNTRHNRYPPEVNQLMQLRGVLTRKINQGQKRHEQHA